MFKFDLVIYVFEFRQFSYNLLPSNEVSFTRQFKIASSFRRFSGNTYICILILWDIIIKASQFQMGLNKELYCCRSVSVAWRNVNDTELVPSVICTLLCFVQVSVLVSLSYVLFGKHFAPSARLCITAFAFGRNSFYPKLVNVKVLM